MSQSAYIPYGQWWSTPFARWQGSLATLHAIKLGAHVARQHLQRVGLDASIFDFGVLGTTVPQKGAFYGLPWLMGEIGAESVAGPTIAQACATGARSLAVATDEITRGDASVALVVAADRVSNGPQIYYPDPTGPGGSGEREAWVLDNFARDPFAAVAMIQTAENVASAHGITGHEQNDLTLRRYEQYSDALKNDAAFLRGFMPLPFDVPDAKFRKQIGKMMGDEGIQQTTAAGLAALKPVLSGGTVTYGGQTHPADGNAGMVVATRERAAELSRNTSVAVQVVSFGQARVERAHMPMAPVPAAQRALKAAGVSIDQIAAIKTHNPFIVNDLYFARHMGVDAGRMNNYGCSLVWGHPQAPTGLRSVIELIEELVLIGGGYGLFTGCAAGDSAMAVVLKVGDA
ncbi:MAG: thiolase family protein [Pararhodobacter sp.]|nr:thiolase family protein [Pararhodobacter sp.]